MGLFPKHVLEYVALAGIPRGPKSKLFVVDPVHGATGNTGESWASPLTTISGALTKCTTGHHDVVLVVASPTAITETAAVDWNLANTHLLGIGAPTRYGKRTRIISGADNLSPFITVSGTGCMFKNLRIVHEQADDIHSLVCVRVTGTRNYFENVEFCGNATTSSAIDGGASLEVDIGGGESHFVDCVIGMDSVISGTGLFAMRSRGAATTNSPARVRFERCIFAGYAGHTGAGLVEVMGGNGFDRAWVFRDCEFVNLGTSTMASAFVFINPDSNSKRFLLINCFGVGFTDWDASNTGMINANMDVLTAGGIAGYLSATNAT